MPEFRSDDTIAAVATPIGEGGISVIRVSGPAALEMVDKIFLPKKNVGAGIRPALAGRPQGAPLHSFPSHTIHMGQIIGENGKAVDQVLVSLFRPPHSYTGEEVVEISCHGGMAVTRKILERLIRSGVRHAEPGEFTRRAFLNGKIDLTQAEAVLDLIKARSERSLEIAARQLTGALSQRLKSLKNELMQVYAHMEAYLDFPDEHLEVYSDGEFAGRFSSVKMEIEKLIASFKRGLILREGASVVILGKPNVGKSSLFNALLERDRALVSEYPGTTRDSLEETLEIEGMTLRLIDTAGLTQAPGHPLERMGMERTRQILEKGDLFLYLVDGSVPLEEADRLTFQELTSCPPQGWPGAHPWGGLSGQTKPILVLINKCDLRAQLDLEELTRFTGEQHFLKISTLTSEGLQQLEKEMVDKVVGDASDGEAITRLRHKHVLEGALEALTKSQDAFQRKESLELVIFDLKIALDHLRELIGEIYSEDLLDVIFAEFCIGK